MSILIDSTCESDIDTLVAAIEAKDVYNRGHSENVTKFALEMARAMQLSPNDMWLLTCAGKLHDMGKIAISGAILNKKGPLTAEEWKEMKMHPVRGAEMLSNFLFMEGCLPIIRHHHERYDGEGYPDGLKGEEIPLLARILGCADAFAAMTSDRAYKPKISLKDAIRELEVNKGKQFDPHIVDVFIEGLISRQPE